MSDAVDDDTPEKPAKPEDAVGYGRPPQQHRFAKGKSGNPKGRPKGSRGLKTDLKTELGEHVIVSENGKRVRLTKQQLMIKQLVTKAVKGELRAITKLADLTILMFGTEDATPAAGSALPADDAAIVEEFLRRNGTSAPDGGEDEL